MERGDGASERGFAPFTKEHLRQLARIAREDELAFIERNPRLQVYNDRLLLVAICQGAALHYLDCEMRSRKKNGVKDLDVYSFYAGHPRVGYPYRGRHGVVDFRESEFGYHPDKRVSFVGRHVDVFGRALVMQPEDHAVEAVRAWLKTSKNRTPRCLRTDAVVGLYPSRYMGAVICDPYAEGYRRSLI